MSIASLVKELRTRTGAGMMDCKKALEACNQDIDSAIDWLRENGIAKAAKKDNRIAAEGLTKVVIDGNNAIIFELNAETDFVAKNAEFLNLLELIGNGLVNSKCKSIEEALAYKINEDTLETIIQQATAKIGEKITFRRFVIIEKNNDEIFASYSHMGGKISSLVLANGNDEIALKNIAMHIAASNPMYLNESEVDSSVLEKERDMLTKEALAEGKPANIVEKMIIGRIKKYLKEICLMDQMFVIDTDKTVAQFAISSSLEIKSFTRFEVGEGIEKVEVDFAAEVAEIVGK